jgi:hypothetical protein
MAWLGMIALILILAAAQELFLETHRRRYGLWRSVRARRFWASPDERRLMWAAATQRDPDARVETSRLVLIAVIGFCVVAGLLVLATGGLSPRR